MSSDHLVSLLIGAGLSVERAQETAGIIVAEGYRKPRTITTREELEALPRGTVIRDAFPSTLELGSYTESVSPKWWDTMPNDGWSKDNGYTFDAIDLPATVLHIPTERASE